MRQIAWALAWPMILAVTVLGSGCHRSSNVPPEDGSVGAGTVVDGSMGKTALIELYDAYTMHIDEHGRSPSSVMDIAPYSIGLPFAFDGIQRGEVVAIWGVDLATAAADPAVMGYETVTPEQGGAVLLTDGTITEMTAQEFEAAPKADAKTS